MISYAMIDDEHMIGANKAIRRYSAMNHERCVSQ